MLGADLLDEPDISGRKGAPVEELVENAGGSSATSNHYAASDRRRVVMTRPNEEEPILKNVLGS